MILWFLLFAAIFIGAALISDRFSPLVGIGGLMIILAVMKAFA